MSRIFALGFTGIAFVARHHGGRYDPAAVALAAAGLLLVLTAFIGRIWCTLYLGGRKNKKLVTAGPYALTRNPLYFFSSAGALGVAAATGMFSAVLIAGTAFALYYPAVIAAEEKVLANLHPAAFKDYCAKVPRF